MKKEESKQFIHWCILGAIGGILMSAGDWLLGCVPLQKTDTGMFNRACYLSGGYSGVVFHLSGAAYRSGGRHHSGHSLSG